MCVRVCWLLTAESKGTVAYNPDTKGLEPSTTQSWNSGGTAGELVAERAKASFEVRRRCFECWCAAMGPCFVKAGSERMRCRE